MLYKVNDFTINKVNYYTEDSSVKLSIYSATHGLFNAKEGSGTIFCIRELRLHPVGYRLAKEKLGNIWCLIWVLFSELSMFK